MELVEASGRYQQGVAVFAEGFFDLSITGFDWELHCDVTARSRKLRKGFDLEHIFFDSKDLFLIELCEIDGSFKADLTSSGGHDLSKCTNRFSVELNVSAEKEAIASTGCELN